MTDDARAVSAQRRAYLAAQPTGTREVLKRVRTAIRAAAPRAVEHFSYGIPGFRLDGKPLVWYAGWKRHASIYPITPRMRSAVGPALEGYEMSKGTVRFPLDEKLPIGLVKKLVRARAAEIREAGRRGR